MDPNAQAPQDQNPPEAQQVPVTFKPNTTPVEAEPEIAPPAVAAAPVSSAPPVAAQVPEPTPAVGPVFGSASSSGVSTDPPASDEKNKKKLFVIAAAGFAVLTAVFVGAYIFLYLPTTPDRLYSTGLERTGEALNKIVEKATSEDQLKAINSTEVTGDYTATTDGKKATAKITSTFDSASSNSTFNLVTPDYSINAQIMTNLAKDAAFPDIFFKIKGLESTGILDLLPSLAPYDNKWVSVSASYLASVATKSDSAEGYNGFDFDTDDAAELTKIAAQKTNEYLFTADPKKAIFDEEKHIDSPIIEGNKTHHYSVQINKAHLEAYCLDLTRSIISSDAYKNLANDPSTSELAEQKSSAEKACRDREADSSPAKYEIWISTKTRLLYKIRVTDGDKSGNYYEIGQNYTGGDEIPMFVRYHNNEEKYDAKVALISNLEKSTTVVKLDVDESAGSSTNKGRGISANLTFKPFEGKINTTPPAGAIPFEQLLSALTGKNSTSSAVSSNNTTNGRTITQSSFQTTQTKAPVELSDFFESLRF